MCERKTFKQHFSLYDKNQLQFFNYFRNENIGNSKSQKNNITFVCESGMNFSEEDITITELKKCSLSFQRIPDVQVCPTRYLNTDTTAEAGELLLLNNGVSH